MDNGVIMRTLTTILLATFLAWGCGGGGGGGSAGGGGTPAPTVTLNAAPGTVGTGGSSTLTWSSTDATSCTASGGWTGAQATSGSQSTGALSASASFSLDCSGAGGTATRSVTVTVTAAPPPSVTLTVAPDTVLVGGSSTLTWSATDATSCTASGGWTGAQATSGSQSTGALSASTSFTLDCSGPGGSANRTVTVTVTTSPPLPTVSLVSSVGSVVSGGSATLTWSSTDATSCAASGGWTGAKATSGNQSTGALTAATNFTLTCSGPGGSATRTVTVTVTAAPPPPTVTLAPSVGTVATGGSATLTWSSTNATSCTASGGWTGAKASSGNQSTGPLTATTNFTLTCSGPGGSATRTVTVTVAPSPAVTLTGTPSTVATGGSATLTWSSTDATSCTASGGWTGAKATSGNQSTGPLTASTNFTLTCSGPGGSATRTVTVTVAPSPAVTLTGTPSTVATGGSSTLTWSSTNATSCTASGGWTGAKATNGSQSTGALNATTNFTLTCSGQGGSATRTVTVTVTPLPTVSLAPSVGTVVSGGSSTLTWSSTDATSCTASGGWTGAKATSGSQSTGPLTATTNFTLTCSGPGGTNAATTTVTVGAAVSAAFPLHVEGGTRHLIDANGKPFLVHGDTPWSLIVQLTRGEVDQYLEDRRQKGFNTILVELIEHFFSTNPPNNAYGQGPFLVPGDFSTPNEAYFAHADYVITKASEKGMLVMLTPAYMGFQGGPEGWYQEMAANGETKLRAYGQYLANRFKAHDNIIWVQGGDYNPPERLLLRALANGILDVDTRWLQTFHGSRGSSALGVLGVSETWLTLNDIYTDENTVVASAFQEYGRSTMPFFLIEARYEGEGASEATVRTQAYQAVLSGSSGHLMGNNPVWLFGSGWQAALNSPGARTLSNLDNLFDSVAWSTLQPDTNNTFLTAGAGSGGTRAVAARASSGAFALIYMPTTRAVTIDLSQISGPNVRARWYDPASGIYTAVAGSPFPAAGSLVFTPTGTNASGYGDWVLVLDSTS
jgi:hypothetical protein